MRTVHKRYVYIAELVRRLELKVPFSMIVDCASGPGDGTKHLIGLGNHVVGIDKNARLIAEGKEAFPHLDLRKGDLLSLPFGDKSVEFFVCSETLEHLDRQQLLKAAAEISRVCRQKSYICITVPSNKKVCFSKKGHKSYLRTARVQKLLGPYGFTLLHRSLFLKNPKRRKFGNRTLVFERS